MDFLISILTMLGLAIGLVAIMVALFSASWQVLLFLLICGIVVSRWLIHQHHLEKVIQDVEADLDPLSAIEEASELAETPTLEEPFLSDSPASDFSASDFSASDSMLSYRGASYPKTASIAANSLALEGKYRGQNWQSSS